ncbi:MAG: M48 family metallopeptidase [Geitlerinemataceae cyanobacterium]
MLEFTVDFARQFAQTQFQKTVTSIAAVSVLAWVPSVALPVSAQSQPSVQKISIIQDKPAIKELTIYEKAAAELPENYYIMYRIVERMARANNLDDRPWRVSISPEDDINAFATQANLIHFYEGMIHQVAGDVSALACVVGHEMAHHQLQHIPIGFAEYYKGYEEIEKIEDEEDREKQREAFLQQMGELNRYQELEADLFGYQYAIAAGFEPEGCLRMLTVLSRLPGSLLERSHPAVPDRIEAIQSLIEEQSSQAIEAIPQELYDAEALTYQWLETAEKLQVNSTRGWSLTEDLEGVLGRSQD